MYTIEIVLNLRAHTPEILIIAPYFPAIFSWTSHFTLLSLSKWLMIVPSSQDDCMRSTEPGTLFKCYWYYYIHFLFFKSLYPPVTPLPSILPGSC